MQRTTERPVEPLSKLDEELGREGVSGELHIVGGAVMCMAMNAREGTRDIGTAYPRTGINDAVDGYLGRCNAFSRSLDLPHLRVFVAEPHDLFAMKCASMRLGPEFHDLEDVRYLLRHLDLRTVVDAIAVVEQYIPADQVPAKTRFALEDLLGP